MAQWRACLQHTLVGLKGGGGPSPPPGVVVLTAALRVTQAPSSPLWRWATLSALNGVPLSDRGRGADTRAPPVVAASQRTLLGMGHSRGGSLARRPAAWLAGGGGEGGGEEGEADGVVPSPHRMRSRDITTGCSRRVAGRGKRCRYRDGHQQIPPGGSV